MRLIYANRSKIKCEHTRELSAACSWQRISYCKVRLIARELRYLCQRFDYLKNGYLCQETKLIEAETKREQQQSQPCKVLLLK